MGKTLVIQVWRPEFRPQEATIYDPRTPALKCEAGGSQETHRSVSLMYTAASGKRYGLKQGERRGQRLPHIPALTHEHTQTGVHTLKMHSRLIAITGKYSRLKVFLSIV